MLTFDDDENELFEQLGLDGRLEVAEGLRRRRGLPLEHRSEQAGRLPGTHASTRRRARLGGAVGLLHPHGEPHLDGPLRGEATHRDRQPRRASARDQLDQPLHPHTARGRRRSGGRPGAGDLGRPGRGRRCNRRGLPVVIPAGTTVTVEFALSGPLDFEEGYRLTVLHQPLVVDDQLSVAVGGHRRRHLDRAGRRGHHRRRDGTHARCRAPSSPCSWPTSERRGSPDSVS